MSDKKSILHVVVKRNDGKHQIWRVQKYALACFLVFSILGVSLTTAKFLAKFSAGSFASHQTKLWQGNFDAKAVKNPSDLKQRSLRLLKSNISSSENTTKIKLNLKSEPKDFDPIFANVILVLESEQFTSFSLQSEKSFVSKRTGNSALILNSEFIFKNLKISSNEDIKSLKIKLIDYNNREAIVEVDTSKLQGKPWKNFKTASK